MNQLLSRMKTIVLPVLLLLFFLLCNPTAAQENHAHNPIIYADVPDMSMVRVGESYYMSSTTMHMSPGVPVMKSNDLVNWKIVSYACDTLASVDALNLYNGENAYGRGSWASCSALPQGYLVYFHLRFNHWQDLYLFHKGY